MNFYRDYGIMGNMKSTLDSTFISTYPGFTSVEPGIVARKSMKTCKLDWCERKYLAKGYCNAHWIRNRDGKDMDEPVRILHGKSRTPEYDIWVQMVQRCTNPKDANYFKYGARGITLCKRWRDSFINFLEDMGERPEGLTLDRKDNNGNYEPSNCRWTSYSVQNVNKRPGGNKNGYTGIHSNGKKWQARFMGNNLGNFFTKEEASKAYEESKAKYLKDTELSE